MEKRRKTFMEVETGKSDITRFREQQALEEESARLALTGYAITARHDFITARAQRGAEHILRLIDEGKHEEAQALMNTDNWGVKDEQQDEQNRSKRQAGKERKDKQKIKSGYRKIKTGEIGDENSRRI
jgi:hypothetical protein